ncbi:MAG: FAD-dependent oxidoreductase [Anaerovoracaceae bacterium]
MSKIQLKINGQDIVTAQGKTILQAALDADIYIPHICYHEDLHHAEVCRLCAVEVEGKEELITSCATPVEDGMVITTNSDRVKKARKLSTELLMTCHPSDCTSCPKYLNCELQSILQYLDVSDARIRKRRHAPPAITTNPVVVHDMTRCILCGRCVRACNELRGVGAINFVRKKDGNIEVGTPKGESLAEAGCKFCGACVEVCPTGSIRDQEGLMDKIKNRKAALVPCRETCPAGIDIPRYIRLTKEGRMSESVAVVREKVPFPGVLGNICDHPCEQECRRQEVNESVAIREIKKYAVEHDNREWKTKGYQKEATGKKVAIVGSGPAGLTAAYYLAKSGHSVTVFEKLAQPGGMMRVGIPPHRLPRTLLDQEIQDIKDVGIEIKSNTNIQSVKELKDQGFDAILVAVGTHQGVRLPIPGNDLDGVLINSEFLRAFSMGENPRVGDRVVVLGGGNVAFDCAGAAHRLGAKEVTLACLEPRDAMKGSPEEIQEALEEGTTIHNSLTFDEIQGMDGKVTGVKVRKVTSFHFGEDGCLNIDVEEDSDHILPADTVIFAVGQRPELTEEFGLHLGRGNRIQIESEENPVAEQGVFAAGDAVRGTVSVITAIADGRRAAIAIDRYLGGDGIIDEKLAPDRNYEAWIGREEGFADLLRCENAKDESERCLQCDLRLIIKPQKFWSEYTYR